METVVGNIKNLSGPRPMPILGWRGNAVQFLRDPITFLRTIYQG